MKSFKIIKRVICVIVILAMLSISLVSCGGTGKPLLKLDKQSISVNVFELYLSRMKGMLCSADYFGEAAKKTAFWETLKDVSTKQTYSDYYTEMVLDTAKTHLAALAEFDRLGLTFTAATYKEFIHFYINGSPAHFDLATDIFSEILAPITLDSDVLEIEKKLCYYVIKYRKEVLKCTKIRMKYNSLL